MRAFLIDPHALTLSDYELAPGLPAIYAALRVDDGFDVVRLGGDAMIFVDDFGLFRQEQKFWRLANSRTFIGGRALVCGLAENGDTAAVPDHISLDLMRSHLIWLGNGAACERMIQIGALNRPETAVSTMGPDGKMIRKVTWSWAPHQMRGAPYGKAVADKTGDAMGEVLFGGPDAKSQ